ncbi:uncharacterized protein LACBIDRAFT_318195 [Laccaria bicolor S238N-H82]|uniref:Predicted protein n=1 Tax=Laccaria bicolor (strain S238N-H82 / ATCC MYA-4686) TaxID=486041 RepID=B0D670_LACBS|nr:uncharacterized protein LACBIDRAFT_318195 [Laccaria bicolor S238N-H82]EDR09892.1 predicted protein [Laccaria bicolor S238N-H82]|eukprot:XP_001879277.1 predicted protein [Laccaria bicolor S238N-H82]
MEVTIPEMLTVIGSGGVLDCCFWRDDDWLLGTSFGFYKCGFVGYRTPPSSHCETRANWGLGNFSSAPAPSVPQLNLLLFLSFFSTPIHFLYILSKTLAFRKKKFPTHQRKIPVY